MRPRQKRTVFAKGYSEAGASYKKRALRGFIPNSGAPNEDINDNNSTLRQRSRMLYMSSPIATSAINTNRTKIIGMGLKLKSIVNSEVLGISNEEAKVWQKKTEAEFKLWSSKKQNCDALGINNFASLQQLALISWLLSGDCFALVKREDATKENPYTLRLHLIEADRISTPTKGGVKLMSVISNTTGETEDNNKIYDGVEVDKNGKIVAYHICNNYPNQLTATQSKWTRVLAYGKESNMPNIFHIMSTERPDQYRGVPF
ncbi:MAG: phage portal protein [Phascolarctobacterium sp.]|nr:phage portal protein [Phascolarctobacterium sp.]